MLSSPPQVKCTKCGIRETVDVATEYEQSKRDGRLAKRSSEDERKEFWKATMIAYLSTGQTIREHAGVTDSAASVADASLKLFDSRF